MPSPEIARVLSIAGSDSGGGAGIQADLKAFAACGVHGMTAITALTAQNTVGVTAVHAVPGEIVIAQVRAVARDIGVDAVKIGMLGTVETIEAVHEALGELDPGTPIVIDPVMVAESGAQLLDPGARDALVTRLLPLAAVVTPNIPEARTLIGTAAPLPAGPVNPAPVPPGSVNPGPLPAGPVNPAPVPAGPYDPNAAPADSASLARAIRSLGPRAVVVTGGHAERAGDVFYDGELLVEIPGARYPDGAGHGSGCTHSSALAAHLALGFTPLEAARAAKELAAAAVRDGLRGIGAGAGPVDVLGLSARRHNVAAGRPPLS